MSTLCAFPAPDWTVCCPLLSLYNIKSQCSFDSAKWLQNWLIPNNHSCLITIILMFLEFQLCFISIPRNSTANLTDQQQASGSNLLKERVGWDLNLRCEPSRECFHSCKIFEPIRTPNSSTKTFSLLSLKGKGGRWVYYTGILNMRGQTQNWSKNLLANLLNATHCTSNITFWKFV